MALVTVNLVDTFEQWRVKTNTIASNGGDLTSLATTDKTSLVNSLNEIQTLSSSNLKNVVEDLTPELGGPLQLNGNNIEGVGNIIITGNFSGTLSSSVVAVTQPNNDNSGKVATTAYVSNMLGAVPVGGDLSGTLGNVEIGANTIGIPELDVTDGTNGQILQTDGSGNLSFIDADLTVGGDITGTLSTAQIAANAVGILELNLNDGNAGDVIVTDGSGTISFQPVFTETTVTPTAGQTVFNITYQPGRIAVYMNGVKLVNGSDFTATNGTDVTFTTATDVIDIVEFHTFV